MPTPVLRERVVYHCSFVIRSGGCLAGTQIPRREMGKNFVLGRLLGLRIGKQ